MTVFHHTDEAFDPEDCENEIAIPIKEQAEGTWPLPSSPCAVSHYNGAHGLTSIYAMLRQQVQENGCIPHSNAYAVYLNDPQKTGPKDMLTKGLSGNPSKHCDFMSARRPV